MGHVESEKQFVVHSDPVWRERSNFIINAALEEEDAPRRFEQLWTRQLSEDRFEICCIRFFLFDVALGDVVTTASDGERRYVLDRVVEPSGRFVFRVWLAEPFQPREQIVEHLTRLGHCWSGHPPTCLPSTRPMHDKRNRSPTSCRSVTNSDNFSTRQADRGEATFPGPAKGRRQA